ncbi:Protein nud1 [Gnomoniopsis sp. IMI 355080]|nr:Protein nud1 [Gnomoniopsis sp. IMI 355080]
MSSYAWLDSLSEDWPSQPNSLRAPHKSPQPGTDPASAKSSATKIPRPRSHTGPERKFVDTPTRNSSVVLNERSPNDVNIPPVSTRRTPSKLSQPSYRGHRASKSYSDLSPAGSIVRNIGSMGSVVHNTIHRNSSSSPGKDQGNTPEWRRRLLQGDLPYGEQRDLFTSAANGLEDIFKPVQNKPSVTQSAGGHDEISRNEMALPSSPPIPVRSQPSSNDDVFSDDSFEQVSPPPRQSKGRPMKYKLNDVGDADISQNSDMSSPAWSLPEDKLTTASSQLSPRSKATGLAENQLRIPSNLSAARHEDFSPILIAKHSSEDGKIDFAPVSLSASELQERLEKLQNDKAFYHSSEDSGSRPGSNSQDTNGLKPLNSFVNFRRGGRSADGSSRLYTLTPALGNTSDMLPEDSLQASTPKAFPSIRVHNPDTGAPRGRIPLLPAAPFPSPEKNTDQAGDTDASPLKLFGQYDTFTNQTLLRRISQFEDPNTSPSQGSLGDRQASAEHMGKPASRAPSNLKRSPQKVAVPTQQPTRSFSQFGAGELDDYAFNDNFTRVSNESDEGSVLHHSVSLSSPDKPSPPPASKIVVGKRRKKPDSTSSTQGRTLSREIAEQAAKFLAASNQHDLAAEYKRHRTSPTKNPTPKRRRTLHQSDIAFGAEDDSLLLSAHGSPQPQLIAGKKRKDARAGDLQQNANANVLASRQMLPPRPRTPTPSQGSSIHRQDRLRPEMRFLQDEIAKLPQPIYGNRKPSIKTEDFLNEAQRIMTAIRGKNGTQSGLASLEESDEDHLRPGDDFFGDEASLPDSTQERLSRPPSRDGKPVPRAAQRQEDPKLVNHLKKYQEHSDMDDILASSLRSLGVSKEDIEAVQALERQSISSRSDSSEVGLFSDPPNIRISQNHLRYENSTAAEQAERFRDLFPSNGSGSESGISTVRTGSSRGSDTRRTIAPESVSHLIPDQVGSMRLDKERNIWVKATPPRRIERKDTLMSEHSEDDVFADIPDLTVDVSKELQNLRLRLAQQSAAAARAAEFESKIKSEQGGTLKSILINNLGDRQGKEDSRSPSRWMKQFAEADDEDVEKEITIHDDRLDESSPKRRTQVNFSSPVSIVIQDMPPVSKSEKQEASAVEPVMLHLPKPRKHQGTRNMSQSSHGLSVPRSRTASGALQRHISVQGQPFVPRPVSIIEEQDEDSRDMKAKFGKGLSIMGDQSIAGRSPSKPGTRQTSLNIVVSTTPRPKPQPRPENAEIIGHYVGNMSLSPLPDFTAHQERSYALEVSYVLGDHNLVTGDGSQTHMSQAVRNLVDKIAEVEAFEPFWEDMKEIELRDKKLGSLHMLDRFCSRLVRLNAAQNSIRALDGIPTTVRELTISRNLLSDLTSWDRLANLQYVDISNNEIKSLSSFRSLVHLRDLVADNTGLTNLDGIKYHETLLTVSARGNAIQELDFEGTCLQRLTNLDLEGNKIRKVENLHELSSLSHLCLKGNLLVEFAPSEPLALKHLVISDNKLKRLDLTEMPRLHMVCADRNRLRTITGLRRTRRLDSLSLREQGGSKPFDLNMLAEAYEVRKLFLSGNRVGTFAPSRAFLNLQILDLANCGLQRLPDDLGQMMPNLRVLNLNFNGLSDVSGLMGISRLKRLHVAGNRFSDYKILAKVLATFAWLTELDLRGTPITHGFYPSMHVVVRKEEDDTQPTIGPFTLPDADPVRDAKFCGLLDMDTRIERRTYERKFVRACKQIQMLDGLLVNKRVRHVKDVVWKAMVERGLLLRPDGSPFDLSNVTLEDDGLSSFATELDDDDKSPSKSSRSPKKRVKNLDESARWEAEDSFA